MKIFYGCYGSAHSSIIASNIHLGLLPNNRVATINEIISAQYYDITKTQDIGRPLFMGRDFNDNYIYAVGMASSRNELTQLLYNYVRLQRGLCREEIIIVNTISLINYQVRIGGFLSRRLNVTLIGRPLTAIGIQRRYMDFVRLVENVKKTSK